MTTLLAEPGGSRTPVVVAHRGYSAVAPQNTLAAFEAAWRAGAPALELDVRLSADGVPVIIHDPVVDRVTDGTGEVAALDAVTIQGFDAGSPFSSVYAGQRVPTLAEVLDFLAPRPGMDLLCEYKGLWTPEQLVPTIAAVDAAGLSGRTIVQGFRRGTVEALQQVAPHLPRGFLCDAAPSDLFRVAEKFDVVTVNPSVAAVLADPGLVQTAHDAGLRVMPWTANEMSEWTGLVEAGVDAIITDRPGELRGWLAR